MSITRRALVLDSGDDASPHMVDILGSNGYIVHVLTIEDRADVYVDKPVYIHLIRDRPGIGDDVEKVIGEVEIALVISQDERYNIDLGKILRSRGVPMVIVSTKSIEAEKDARESGLIPINTAHSMIREIMLILRLRYTKIVPLDELIGAISMYVTSDSRLIGDSLGELERKYSVKALVVREDKILVDPDIVIQQGDRITAIGPNDKLREMASR